MLVDESEMVQSGTDAMKPITMARTLEEKREHGQGERREEEGGRSLHLSEENQYEVLKRWSKLAKSVQAST